MRDRDYTVKVFADAVQSKLRTLESIPEEYRKEVEEKIWERENGCQGNAP